MLQLLPLLQAIHSDRLGRCVMNSDPVLPWIEPVSGARYLLPQPAAARQLLEQAVGLP